MKSAKLVLCISLASVICLCQESKNPSHRLAAPTYYIAVAGDLEDANTVRIRGASNLPGGANIAVSINTGERVYTDKVCIPLDRGGLFTQELDPKKGMKFERGLLVSAAFLTNLCKQPETVLSIVGKKGEHLGNDNYDNSVNVESGETKGMTNNPQLVQVSGWFFGLSAQATLE